MAWKPDICVYHANCNDGFASACIVRSRWPDGVVYIPCSYGDQPLTPDEVTDKNVLIADFSFSHEQLETMAQRARSIIILDHHLTAAEALKHFTLNTDTQAFNYQVADEIQIALHPHQPRISAIFDMAESGATLTWKFCFPDKVMPLFYAYIRDHDLYAHEMVDSEEISAAVSSHARDFDVWGKLIEGPTLDLATDGRAILRAKDVMIDSLMDQAVSVIIGGHVVPALNMIPPLASRAGHKILETNPAAPFAATWYRAFGEFHWSLRSEDDRISVAEVAKKHGGGGHRNAAGFATTSDLTC